MLILGNVLIALGLVSLVFACLLVQGDWWKNPSIANKLAIVLGVIFVALIIIGVKIISNEKAENVDNITANESNIVAEDSNISAHNSELSISDSKVVINSDNFENLIIVDSNGNEYKIVKAE